MNKSLIGPEIEVDQVPEIGFISHARERVRSTVQIMLSMVSAIMLMLVLSTPVMAEGGGTSSVVHVVSAVQWSGILGDIASSLTAVVVPVIGLAAGLMLVVLVFRVIKKFLRAGG